MADVVVRRNVHIEIQHYDAMIASLRYDNERRSDPVMLEIRHNMAAATSSSSPEYMTVEKFRKLREMLNEFGDELEAVVKSVDKQ